MPIYTRTGDKGTTAVFGGRRVSKDDVQVHAYGALDELDACIALAGALVTDNNDASLLLDIQKDLYHIMNILAGGKLTKAQHTTIKDRITTFEKTIDTITKDLPELHSFILLQGDQCVGQLHVARAVTRRAERHLVTFLSENIDMVNTQRDLMLQYLNRLSDLLFTLARKYNKGKEIAIDSRT